jgi:hypothetical protein
MITLLNECKHLESPSVHTRVDKPLLINERLCIYASTSFVDHRSLDMVRSNMGSPWLFVFLSFLPIDGQVEYESLRLGPLCHRDYKG